MSKPNQSNEMMIAMKQPKSKTMKRLIYLLPIALSLGFFACMPPEETKGSLADLKSEKASLEKQLADLEEKIAKMDTTKKKVYPKVSFHKTQRGKFEHFFRAQGEVESDQNVMLTPEVAGMVTSIEVKEGQAVQKGQVIARFDSELIAANKQELLEQIDLAQYNAEKQEKLFEKGLTTEIALKQAKAQLATLEKTLKTIETQAGKTKMTAPFDGFIEELIGKEGEMATPGMPFARLVGSAQPYVTADVSEIYLSKLQKGNYARISFNALGEQFDVDSAQIKTIGRFVNPANRTIRVRVSLPQKDKYIPNLVATINIRDYMNDSAITVPSGTITQNAAGKEIVYVARKQNAKDYELEEVEVETGETYAGMTEIISGVGPNELVVDKGSHSAYNGLVVRELDK